MKIKVEYKSAYGQARYYPTCDKAKALAHLMGVKTFTAGAMLDITNRLGAEVLVSFAEIPGFEAPLVNLSV